MELLENFLSYIVSGTDAIEEEEKYFRIIRREYGIEDGKYYTRIKQ